ncbi:MAG: hypothetical protein QW791_07860 [Candidatus Bathyarchaeia archaeon]
MKSVLEQNGGFFIEFEMLAEMEGALEQLFAFRPLNSSLLSLAGNFFALK